MNIYSGPYHFLSSVLFPDGHQYSYDKDIEVSYQDATCLSISHIGTDLINGIPPQEFDLTMSWLGNALYPIKIDMDTAGELKRIVNIDEVRKRYSSEGVHIMAYYEQSPLIVRYVTDCLKRLRDEKQLMQHLHRSNLYQLIALCMDLPHRSYQLVDFPFTEDTLALHFSTEDENETELLLTVHDIQTTRQFLSHEGRAYVHKSGPSSFDHIQLLLTVEVVNEGYYTRKLELKRIENYNER